MMGIQGLYKDFLIDGRRSTIEGVRLGDQKKFLNILQISHHISIKLSVYTFLRLQNLSETLNEREGTLRHPQVPKKRTTGWPIYRLAILSLVQIFSKPIKINVFRSSNVLADKPDTPHEPYIRWGYCEPPPPPGREGYLGNYWLFCHWFKSFKKP